MDEYISKEAVERLLRDLSEKELNSSGPYGIVTSSVLNKAEKAISEMPAADVQPIDDWVPVKDRLPDDSEDVLVWFEYFIYGEYNRWVKRYGIGHYFEYTRNWLIKGETGWKQLRVIAWQKLPKKPKGE